jgi:Arc/MetJ-type ribon-helix-helix transcriptional regulator
MKKIEADRPQVNVRLTDELIRLLDAKRVEMLPELGTIPTRSDVVRIAIERFLKPAPKTKTGPK